MKSVVERLEKLQGPKRPKYVGVRFTQGEYDSLSTLAEKAGVSVSVVVRTAVEDFLVRAKGEEV